jgi:serine/threonine-protein kinase
MEHIPGATLSERLDRGGFTPAAIKTLARELLSAIACVHDHGVLHRDIKPANVLLDSDGSARLTDFGLARLEASSQITQPGEVVGTLRFLAPELLDGSPSTRQSDLYALGVLLRTAVGESESPPEVQELITQLTEVSPHARPRDAHAALAQLDAKLRRPAHHRKHVHSTKPSRPHPSARQAPHAKQTRDRVIAISALLAVVGGTSLVVASSGGGSSAPPTASVTARPAGTQTTTSGTPTTTEAVLHKFAPPATVAQQLQSLEISVRRATRP